MFGVKVFTLRLKRSDSTVAHVLETIRKRACEGISAKDALEGVDVPRRTAELHFRELTGVPYLTKYAPSGSGASRNCSRIPVFRSRRLPPAADGSPPPGSGCFSAVKRAFR